MIVKFVGLIITIIFIFIIGKEYLEIKKERIKLEKKLRGINDYKQF